MRVSACEMDVASLSIQHQPAPDDVSSPIELPVTHVAPPRLTPNHPSHPPLAHHSVTLSAGVKLQREAASPSPAAARLCCALTQTQN